MNLKKVFVALCSVGLLSLATVHGSPDFRQLTYIQDGDDDCDVNPVAILILVFVMMGWALIWVIILCCDQKYSVMYSPELVAERVPVQSGPQVVVQSSGPVTNHPIRARQNSSSSSSSEEQGADYTQNYYIQGDQAPPPVYTEEVMEKTSVGLFCDGHLTFGLGLYRGDFLRTFRILTILTIWVFDLFVIGLFFKGQENIDGGDDRIGSDDIFDDYENEYILYGVYTLIVSIPLAVFLIYAFSSTKGQPQCLFTFALVLALVVIIGSVVGIVFLSVDFCHQWSGYWGITYMFVLAVEVLVLETIYMAARSCCRKANQNNNQGQNLSVFVF